MTAPLAVPAQRKRINEIVPGRLYQRGQILTWSREDKVALITERRIGVIVNLWPKLDPDLTGSLVEWYLYLPVERSRDILGQQVLAAAAGVSIYLGARPEKSALILCEAGKTRSVFFSALVLKNLRGVTRTSAYDTVVAAVPNHSLKDFMVEYLHG